MDDRNYRIISRARFLQAAGFIPSAFLFSPKKVFAQASTIISIKNVAATKPMTVQAVRGNVHVARGSGGKIGLSSGKEGMLVAEAGIALSTDRKRVG